MGYNNRQPLRRRCLKYPSSIMQATPKSKPATRGKLSLSSSLYYFMIDASVFRFDFNITSDT